MRWNTNRTFLRLVCEHLSAVWAVRAVPVLALLLVSGVLECWRHLTGRFNIPLTGSKSSSITAQESNPAFSDYPHSPPALIPHPGSFLSAAPPFGLVSSSLLYRLAPALLLVFMEAVRGQCCLSIRPPADCIWSEWIVFRLDVFASLPSLSSPLQSGPTFLFLVVKDRGINQTENRTQHKENNDDLLHTM